MCNPEQCPLAQLCEERTSIAKYVLNEMVQTEETMTEDVEALVRDQHLDDVRGVGLKASQLINASWNRSLLSTEIALESLTQGVETLYCKGTVKRRKFGFFGAVESVECGSEDRLARLAGQTERLLPEDAMLDISPESAGG